VIRRLVALPSCDPATLKTFRPAALPERVSAPWLRVVAPVAGRVARKADTLCKLLRAAPKSTEGVAWVSVPLGTLTRLSVALPPTTAFPLVIVPRV